MKLPTLREVDDWYIQRILAECKGKGGKERAAKILGVSLKTLYNRLQKLTRKES